MRNILNKGINSNMLKTIAIIAMVIDHIGFYFSDLLPTGVYLVCRYIGRIAMPIFVYMLVQGFFHTKNFKKYISRIGIFAVITQILITVTIFFNIKFVSSYTSAEQVYTTGNILFSFVISLIVLKLLHQDIIIKKWTHNKNLSLKIIVIFAIVIICILMPLDYDIEVLILSMLMYYVEKLRIKVLMEKNSMNLSLKNIVINNMSDDKIKLVYLALIFLIISVLVVYFNASWVVLLSIIPISLYNEQRGKINLKYVYYVIFPLHHVLLYSLAMLITLT